MPVLKSLKKDTSYNSSLLYNTSGLARIDFSVTTARHETPGIAQAPPRTDMSCEGSAEPAAQKPRVSLVSRLKIVQGEAPAATPCNYTKQAGLWNPFHDLENHADNFRNHSKQRKLKKHPAAAGYGASSGLHRIRHPRPQNHENQRNVSDSRVLSQNSRDGKSQVKRKFRFRKRHCDIDTRTTHAVVDAVKRGQNIGGQRSGRSFFLFTRCGRGQGAQKFHSPPLRSTTGILVWCVETPHRNRKFSI